MEIGVAEPHNSNPAIPSRRPSHREQCFYVGAPCYAVIGSDQRVENLIIRS
jgi:hypothetical protein